MKFLKYLDRSLAVLMILAAIFFLLDHYGFISGQAMMDALVAGS